MGSYVMRLPGSDIELDFREYFPGAGSRDIGVMCLFKDLVVVACETKFRSKERGPNEHVWVYEIERRRIVDAFVSHLSEKHFSPLRDIEVDRFVGLMIEGCEKASVRDLAASGALMWRKTYRLV